MPTFFATPAAFRGWLKRYHAKETELWVGFYKKASGRGGMVYQQALDEALCFGWIDGLVKSVDGESYMQRFTPRKATSHWSLVNVRRVGELEAEGRMEDAGRAAFAQRTAERTGKASFESPMGTFAAGQRKAFKASGKAWAFFEAQPPGYRRTAIHWVSTAKQEATRARRLALLIACSERGERVPQFVSPPGKK